MTKQELKAKIDKLENGIKSKATPSNLIAPLKAQKAKLEKELEDMDAAEKKAVKTKKVSKVAEKIKAAKTSVAKKTPAKAPAKEERKKDNIVRDGDRKSLPAGKRISKTGKVYYEMRANRTDKQTSKKPYLADGGELTEKKLLVLKADDEKGGNVFVSEEVVKVKDLDDAKSKVKEFVSKYNLDDKTFTGGRYFKLVKTSKKTGNVTSSDVKSENLGTIDYKGNFKSSGSKMADGGKTDWGADLGGGFSIGNDVYITDSKSLFQGKTGFVSGSVGKDLLVTIMDNGNERSVVVSKKGVEKLDAPEYANGGEVSKKYVVFFTRFNNGKSVPRVVEMYDNESDAKEYVESQKKLGEKGFKIKQAKDMPIYSMINIVDKSKYKELKDLIHSKDKVDAFFDGKDSFYKKDYGWVKPYGYVWENWKLVSAPNETMAKGGAVKKAPMIYEFKAILRDEDDNIKEKKEFKVRATARDSAYNKAYKKYPKPYFVELYNSYSADKMADGGDIYDDMEQDIDFANDKAKKIVNSLESLGYKVVKLHEADYDTDAQIDLSEKVNIQVGLEGDLSIVIEKEEGKFTYIDCGKSYATLLIKLSNIDKQYMEKGGKTKRTVKLTLSDKDSYDYTYKQDGATASITFGFGKEPFQYEVKKISKSLEPLQQDILDTFTLQGIKQHEYKGGFSEAIKHLDTSILENADEFAKGGKLKIGDIVVIKNPLADEDPNQLYVVIQEDIEKFSDDEQIDIRVLNEDKKWAYPPIVRVEKKDLEIVYDVESYNKMADGGKLDKDISDKIDQDLKLIDTKKEKYKKELNQLKSENSQDRDTISYLEYELESLDKLHQKLSSIKNSKMSHGGYVIFEGRDNYNDKPLYKVISKDEDNDYDGEFHDNREDAEKELNELKNKNMNYAKGGITREGNHLMHFEPYFEKEVEVASIDEDSKTIRPSHGYFHPNKIGKKSIAWAKKNGYKFIQDGKEFEDGGYMVDGGELKKVTDGDDTYYLTYIDSTHFYLSNSKDYKGNAFHIAEFRSRPFYDEVKSWLKSHKGEMMADGGEVPAHFGSGKNIDVFGYQTEHFDICGTAVKEFESAMEIMQNAKESEKESLARCAKYVDGLFGIEKLVVETAGADDANFYEAVSDIMSASIYNYRAEMSINLFSFVPQHLKEIAIRMEKAEKGGLYALGGMTAGRWYRDKSGEEFKFIGKIDSGENKGKFLFTDGQKSVYKDLEDFEGGRPKETKLFGFFEDGGSVAEGNYEMLMSNIKAIKHHAEELEGAVKPNTEIEAWVLSKSERAETDLSDITHYLDGLKMAKGGYMADGGKVDVKDLTYPKYEVSKPEFEAGFGKGKFKIPDMWEVGGFRFDKEKDAKAFYDKLKGIDNMSDYLEINTIKMQDFFDKKYQPSEYKEPKVGSPYPFSAFQKAKHKQQFQFLEIKGGEEYTIDFVLDKVVLDKALGWRKFGNEWVYGDYIYDFEGYASVGSGAIKLILVKTFEKGGYMADGGYVANDISEMSVSSSSDGKFTLSGSPIGMTAYEFSKKLQQSNFDLTGIELDPEYSKFFAHGSKSDIDRLHEFLRFKRFSFRKSPKSKMADGGYMAKGGDLSSIKKKYEENEDENAHSENVVLLAKHFGTKEDLAKAKEILALHEKEGSLSSENGKKRQELHLKLIDKARAEMGKQDIEFEKGGMMAEGGGVGEIDMEKVESAAKFYTDESRWSTKPTIGKFEAEIKEIKELKRKLDNKETTPSKIIGSGYKSSLARPLAYRWLKEQLLIAERAIEMLKEKEKMAKGGYMASGARIPFLKFEDAVVAKKDVKKGELPKNFSYVEKEKKLYYLPNVTADWVVVGEFVTKKEAINFILKELEGEGFASGGKVKFADKVKSVQESLLKRKKVSPKVQKDYGKTYSKAEAKESAQRIVGSRMAQLKEKMAKKKK